MDLRTAAVEQRAAAPMLRFLVEQVVVPAPRDAVWRGASGSHREAPLRGGVVNRTVQIKGRDARGVPVQPADVALVRHCRANHSSFVGSDYLIKGVAGAILWKLLTTQAATGRCAFSNRERRAMPDLGLPELSDNLEARLVLLQRRLAERCPAIGLEKAGRGQQRLVLRGRLELLEADG